MSEKVVAVTGSTGYVASVLIARLLEKGYRIHATVRSISSKKHEPLLALPLSDKITFFEADLLKEGSFADAFKGVECVFHTASPFQWANITDPQKELVDPALNGTRNVIKEALKSPTVTTIVVTSSVAAIRGNRPQDHIFTEDDWNDMSTIENAPYPYSKTVAEREAHLLLKDSNVRLVVMNPSFVMGPPIGSHLDATSIKSMISLLSGAYNENGAPTSNFGIVDVRDVADGHIAGYENKNAHGRYILSSETTKSFLDFVSALRSSGKFDDWTLPSKFNGQLGVGIKISHQKAVTELGLKFTDFQSTIVDMALRLCEMGLVKKP